MDLKIPDKLAFRQKEVMNLTRLDSRVIDYWEKEFKVYKAVISKNGDKFYSRNDILIILRIKEFLIEKKLTKDEVREKLSAIVQTVDEKVGNNQQEPGGKAGKGLDKIRSELNDILTLLDKDDKK